MLKIADCIVNGHDVWLVVVAGLVCVLASHTCFSLLYRAGQQQGKQTLAWLAAAAVAMGSGVWATHFVAMLAYRTPLMVGYDIPLSSLSAAIAIGFSGVALWLALHCLRFLGGAVHGAMIGPMQIGRASRWERVGQYGADTV